MADTKKPSLTVLGGPMAGTRFVFEDASEEITVGSDEGCSFRLELPGVSPNHARIVIEGGAMFIHDTDTASERGLHVNDNRVGPGGTALRNGDIVWLGTPGDAEVVMLQCILPRLTPVSSAPAPPPAAYSSPAATPLPPPLAPEDETATVNLEADTLFGAETVIQPPAAAAEPPVAVAQEFVVAEEPAEEPARRPAEPEPVTFAMDDEPTHMLPPSAVRFEDETEINETVMDAPFVIAEESSTVVLDSMDVTGEMPEPTVVLPAEPEHALPMPPLKPTVSVPPPTPVKPPPAARIPTGATTRPVSRPAPSARPRPQPADRTIPPPPRAKGGSSTGLYAGLGIAALLVLGGGAYGAWRYLSNKPGTPVAQVSPPPATRPPAGAPLVTQPTPRPVATPDSTPLEPPPSAPVAVATPAPKASVAPAVSPSPSPSPSPKKGSPTPPPVTTAAGPSAEALRAQQVASLLGQAETALAARQYDQAIGHFDEVLRIDAQNAKALADKATAVSLRAAALKKFVPGRTAVKTEKASGGLAGFDSGDVAVQKAPDFLGRIEFEMSPASGIKPGDPYTLRFFLVNDGKKAIRIQGITLSTVVNGTGSGTPVSAATREVAPQQRAQLGEVSGSWKDGTTSWSAELLVTANKGDSLKNQIAWR